MKKFILTLTCLFSISIMLAQTEITGTVKDNSGVPVAGANVLITGSTSGTTSDFDGNFSFSTNVKGEQTLQVSYLGYATFNQKINLNGTKMTLQIVLKEGGNTLDEVVLTATSSTRSQKETPLSITSFGAKELSKTNTSSQADILMSVPGITAEGGGGEVASNIFVRGIAFWRSISI